jgi:hypothetical protein
VESGKERTKATSPEEGDTYILTATLLLDGITLDLPGS